ncbi:hypothetical protein Aca07nite_03180 [Actinoplanes capillaceus]|uniref:Dynamin family protein n=1 Tax=Actinoplanes campanulatus TaxID=113559 RepID=A0ABQ3WA53_9ACTN|nr:hypothetical protein [Actinoplanes capillaceus]GID43043.1 hypothetical protein Aca07nite_03180 [Actinoplanes capillaceus]
MSVTELLQDARAVITALNAEPFDDNAALLKWRQELEQHANDLIQQAEDPIAIGVVGEFSVGKSMLIGTLLGRPDLLPVEQRATTGNVTALYLRPAEPGTRTAIDGDATVRFLSEPELSRCVEYMLSELAAALRQVHRVEALEQLAGYDPVADGWDRFDAWCRRHIWPGPDAEAIGNLEVRKIAVELAAMRDGHLAGRDLLKAQVSVSHAIVRAALDLGDEAPDLDEFPRRPGLPALTLNGIQTDSAQLQRSFSLIRRVEYRVLVDPDFWPLDGLRGDNEVLLLDFPGLTARRSAKRDEFLSRSVLRDIHTIITVYDSGKAGTDVPDKFYTMLEEHGRPRTELRESILAVGNAFDRVNEPDLPPSGPITLERLRGASQQYNDLYNGALLLVDKRDERIVLTSSVVAIEKRGIPTSFTGQEAAKLATARAGVPEVLVRWRSVARRLVEAEPDSPWVPTIEAFVADGGFDHLRRLIERHATEHGVANKLSTMKRQHARLREALERLCRLLPHHDLPRGANAMEQARAKLLELTDDMRRRHEALFRALGDFRDPLTVVMATGEPLIEAVQNDATTAVASWEAWRTVLQRADGGLIRKDAPAAQGPAGGLRARFPTAPRARYDSTGAFREPYLETCGRYIHAGRRAFAEAVRVWVEEQSTETSELRLRINDDDIQDLLRTGLLRLTGDADTVETRMQGLGLLADLEWFVIPAPTEAEAVDGEAAAAVEYGFPAERERALPWNVSVPEKAGDRQQQMVRHQLYLFRQRRELDNAVVSVVTAELVRQIEAFYELRRDDLAVVSEQMLTRDEIRRMFPVDRPAGQEEDAAEPDRSESPLRSLLRQWRERDDQPGV